MYSEKQIEFKTRWLQQQLLRSSSEADSRNVLSLFQPESVANALGIQLEMAEDLGMIQHSESNYRVAGFLDRAANKIVVSKGFSDHVIRFTTAHELGHWILHPKKAIIHRDRPLDGSYVHGVKPQIEREADYFAGCLLMPKRIVTRELLDRFPIVLPADLTQAEIFHLNRGRTRALIDLTSSAKEKAQALASATMFNNCRFLSLAEKFGVSVEACAIRLLQLNLVR